jgi:hypothetical protein
MTYINDYAWDSWNAITACICSWISEAGHEWAWLFSFGPMALCLLGVHLVFRNIFTILWFSFKFLIAGIVYMHIRTLMAWTVHPFSFESLIFGNSIGSSYTLLSPGIQILCEKIVLIVSSVCPRCFAVVNIPPPTSPSSPWVDWMSSQLFL